MPKKCNPYGNSGEEWRQRWQTPSDVICVVREIIGEIDWDVAANAANAVLKGGRYFGPGGAAEDGLVADWGDYIAPRQIAWCNPPFNSVEPWAEKCAMEAYRWNIRSVMLCNVSPETEWWRKWVMCAQEVHYLFPRINFIPPPDAPANARSGNSKSQTFVVWRPNWQSYRTVSPLTTSVRWK
jgi:phage N-6-adenine-methyltransferase